MAKKAIKPTAKAPAKPKVAAKKAAKTVVSKGKEKAVKKPVAKKVEKKAVKPAAKPVAKKVIKPIAKKVVKPVAKKVVKPVAKKVVKPIAKKVVKPVAKKVVKPVAKAVKKEVKSSKKVVKVVIKKKVQEVKKAVKPVIKKAAPAKKIEVKKAVVPAKKQTPASKSKVVTKKAAPVKKVEPKKALAPAKKAAPVAKPTPTKKAAPVAKPAPSKKSAPVAKPTASKKAAPVAPAKPVKKGKAAKAEDVAEVPVVLAPEDEAILAEALTIAKPKREAKVRKEVIAEGPIDGKPRTFKIGIAPALVEKRVANPIHVASEMDPKQAIFVPIAKPEKHEKNQTNDTETMISINQMNKSNSEDAKKGISVESKLRHLFALQLIDSRIDKIRSTRGELPYEVEDLKDEVSGLEARLARLNGEFKGAEESIVACKSSIKEAEALIVKYKEQLNKVKNNREFDSLNKEIEFQELEIELQSKHIRTADSLKLTKQAEIDNASTKLAERTNDLNLKETELTELMSETQKEEDFLSKRSDDAKKHIDLHLLERYVRMRKSAQNGLAVVPIERDASAGSFIQIPAQVQMDVRLRKRIITDEHSGRILVDEEMAYEEELKFKEVLLKEMAK
jgi:predicted  nucleic acid-binding Zn-ribbon protein